MKNEKNDNLIEKCEEVAGLMKSLSHPQRLVLLCKLVESSRTVGDLQDLCGLSQSMTSQFLSKMKLEGLVEAEKEGKHVTYHIKDPRVKKLMHALSKVFCD